VYSAISVRERKYNMMDPFRVTAKPTLLGVAVTYTSFVQMELQGFEPFGREPTTL